MNTRRPSYNCKPRAVVQLQIDGVQYDLSNLLMPAKEPRNPLLGRIALVDESTAPALMPSRCQRSQRSRRNINMTVDAMLDPANFQRNYNKQAEATQRHGLKKPPIYYHKESIQKKQPPSSPPPRSGLPRSEKGSKSQACHLDHAQELCSNRLQKRPLSTSSTPLQQPVMVEIGPGVHERLRGSVETMRAAQVGAVTQVKCDCCAQHILCVHDAAFFICPSCRVISSVSGGVHGVGLGYIV